MPDRTAVYDELAAREWPDGSIEDRMQAVVDALWDGLHETGVSWLGFYFDRPEEPDEHRLLLGPCRDKPACSPLGLHGVCGQGIVSGQTRLVHDVADLGDAYVACDPRDRSEIVVPLLDADGRAWAVLDLDSHELGAFSEADDAGLRRVLRAAGLLVA